MYDVQGRKRFPGNFKMTIREALGDNDDVLIRFNRHGNIYRSRRDRFPNGERVTLPNMASLVPVLFVDGKWVPSYLSPTVVRPWTDVCEVVTS